MSYNINKNIKCTLPSGTFKGSTASTNHTLPKELISTNPLVRDDLMSWGDDPSEEILQRHGN